MNKKTPRNSQFVPDERADSTAHLDLTKMRRASFQNLKPTSATISLRMPVWMLHEIKRLANQRDVPYQSFIKMILAERLQLKAERPGAAGR
jgi:predicted DNA binding CopG/RHH family protein